MELGADAAVDLDDPLLDEADEGAGRGRREAGKAERRRRIIEAARDLIRETGDAGLSMRALAARAGVSLATPYNLFGSKGAIVVALLQDVRQFHEQFGAKRSADPLERIFTGMELAVSFYVEDPSFYKTLWAAVYNIQGEVRAAIFNKKRDAFWRGLLVDAMAAGAIQPGVDPDVLLQQMNYIFRSAMLDWVLGEVAPEDLAATVTYGYALLLRGVATPEWQGPLRLRLLDSQQRLKAAAG